MSANIEYVLEAQGVSLSYRQKRENKPVLRDFSLQLKKGEVIAILGFSGSGKSSLLRVLAGLNAANKGQVLVQGKTIKGPHPQIGFMFQDPCLLPWLNLKANVGFGLNFKHQKRVSKAERGARVQAALQEVGLEEAASSYPSSLSGGMAQRGSLARSLVRQPDILLLDEPFSALDAVTRSEMQQLLLEVTKKHRTSVVLVTHDIDEALQVADRVLLLGGQPSSLAGSWGLTTINRATDSLQRVRIHKDIVDTLRNGRHLSCEPVPDALMAIPA